MKVKLIQLTQNPIDVMYVSARTCYSEKSPIEMWEDINDYSKYIMQTEELINIKISPDDTKDMKNQEEKRWNLVKKVLDSGHQSVAEHVYFTFAIEGISRICSHQLVRHRHCTFSQQSQRYVEFKESYETLLEAFDGDVSQQEEYLKTTANKYFTNVTSDNYRDYIQALINYLGAIKRGTKPEDARNILPNCTKTNITFSCNYRELIHICNLRLCTRAQKEIRDLFKLIKEEVNKVEPRLAEYLVPNCEVSGFCKEHQSCGRKPKLKTF